MSFVSCTTSDVGLCSFLESIEHDFIKAIMVYTNYQMRIMKSYKYVSYLDKIHCHKWCRVSGPPNQFMIWILRTIFQLEKF